MTNELKTNIEQAGFIVSVLTVVFICAIIGLFCNIVKFQSLSYGMYSIAVLTLLLPISRVFGK